MSGITNRNVFLIEWSTLTSWSPMPLPIWHPPLIKNGTSAPIKDPILSKSFNEIFKL